MLESILCPIICFSSIYICIKDENDKIKKRSKKNKPTRQTIN